MDRQAAIFIIGTIAFIIGIGMGAVMFGNQASSEIIEQGHAQKLPTDHNAEHEEIQPFAASDPLPAIGLVIQNDSQSGWNVQILLENYEILPPTGSQNTENGKGHAVLFIDNQRISKIYSPWFHIPDLTQGEHEIKVGLYTTKGAPWTANAELIEAKKKIEV